MSTRAISAMGATAATVAWAGVFALGGIGGDDLLPAAMPSVNFPAENPFSEQKRVLGKLLFWDEQLSSSNTVSCGTCHQPNAGGADPVVAIAPGPDNLFGTQDDEFNSFGVIAGDAQNDYTPTPPFGFERQTTDRATNPAVMSMYAPELFWDGRAQGQFRDPLTDEVVIAEGGALESQAVGPIVSSVEMAHADRDWAAVTAKLASVVPLALASDLPSDMAEAIAIYREYPEMFEAAFGDETITPARIGMAIATYERTLVPDQTPWDAFIAGDTGAMTMAQVRGWNAFNNSRCAVCHTPPLFTDNTFRNIGVRPTRQDVGRQEVTGNPADRGTFKVPTLRNVGLKPTLMHTGDFEALNRVLTFYRGGGAGGNNNRDPLLPVDIPIQMRGDVVDFLRNGLTDPRVANETFPFDRPTLYTERLADQPINLGGATAGSNGVAPRLISSGPPNLGNDDFRFGVHFALGDTVAWVAMSQNPPVDGVVEPDELLGPIVIEGVGAGDGFGTLHWGIPADPSLEGQARYLQWRIVDPEAVDGIAFSDAVRIAFFCGPYCPCASDLDGDGQTDADDFFFYLDAFAAGNSDVCDIDRDADCDAEDFFGYLDLFAAGC